MSQIFGKVDEEVGLQMCQRIAATFEHASIQEINIGDNGISPAMLEALLPLFNKGLKKLYAKHGGWASQHLQMIAPLGHSFEALILDHNDFSDGDGSGPFWNMILGNSPDLEKLTICGW